MDNTLLIGLSQQTALQRNVDIIAHNLANASTTAYKTERPLFRTYLTNIKDVAGRNDQAKFVSDYATIRDTTEGALRPTGNDLDFAVSGTGYFVVQTPAGERYTRNGHLRIDNQGQLTTSDGLPILDTAHAPITFGPDEKSIVVAKDGSLSTSTGPKAKINLVEFTSEGGLSRVGDSLYTTDETPQPATNSQILQGTIEDSNVSSVSEITTMIDLLRAYTSTTQLLRQAEDMQQRTVQQLGQTN